MQRFWNMQGLWNNILGLLRAFISFPFKKCTLFNTRLIFLCWSYKEIIFSLYRTEMNTLNRRAAWRAWPLAKLNVPVKIIGGVLCHPGPSPCYGNEKSVVFNRIFDLERTENALPSKARKPREVSEVNPARARSFSSLWAEVTNPAHPNDHPNHL